MSITELPLLTVVSVAASGSIMIFDVSGREVRDSVGRAVSAGVYCYRVVTPLDKLSIKAIPTR